MTYLDTDDLDAELDRARSALTAGLLRLPHLPWRADHQLWDVAQKILPDLDPRTGANPVVGVATTVDDAGPRVFTLLAYEADVDMDHTADAFGIRYPILPVVSGPILPAARPAQGGDSISGDGPGGQSGTFGCLVRTVAGDELILGCNHTLAGVNQSTVNHDTVRQPSAADGGAPPDVLGKLVNYVVISLGGYLSNTMDAAVAEPAHPTVVQSGVRGLGAITGVGAALAYEDRVHKMGWKTSYTVGTYRYKVSYTTDFSGVGKALFVDQYGVVGDDPTIGFAQQGDSGAVVLTESSDELVGMVIGVAADANLALVSPIDSVLTAFGVTPVL